MPFIEDIPEDETWDHFNNHLSFDFYEIQIPIVPELRWKEVADLMAGDSRFAQSGMASGDGFTRWQDWAAQLKVALNSVD